MILTIWNLGFVFTSLEFIMNLRSSSNYYNYYNFFLISSIQCNFIMFKMIDNNFVQYHHLHCLQKIVELFKVCLVGTSCLTFHNKKIEMKFHDILFSKVIELSAEF